MNIAKTNILIDNTTPIIMGDKSNNILLTSYIVNE